jgi:anti-sigma-K factor RskA
MDIGAYIESGILESYVLGLCSEEEAREVEALCTEYPELKAELLQVQESVNAYAAMHSRTPQPFVKQRIFEEIGQLETGKKEAKVLAIGSARYRFAIAASLALFALSLIGNVIMYNKYKAASEQVIALNTEKNQLADLMQTNQVKLEHMHRDMSVLSDPMVEKVMMKGVDKSPASLAMIYWNKASKEVFIEVKNLPVPEQGKQYQLWAIVNGKPVDAGMITMAEGDSSLHRMKDFDSAQAFAITLENEGGSPVPTLAEMYVMGAVSL